MYKPIPAVRMPVCLAQNRLDHLAIDVCQAKVAAGIAINQSGVVEPHQVQNGGVKIVHVNRFFHGANTVLVGRAVDIPGPNARPGQPRAKRPAMVFSPSVVGRIVKRSPAELSGPDDEHFIQQPAPTVFGSQLRLPIPRDDGHSLAFRTAPGILSDGTTAVSKW